MNKLFKVIGFDLDGTLVNSLPDLTLSINLALADLHLPEAPATQVLNWIGQGASILIANAIDWATKQHSIKITAQDRNEIIAKFNYYYGQNICNKSQLFPNVKATLEILKQKGYTLVVITNKPTIHVKPVLAAFGIADLFSDTLGGQSLPAIKPHPAPLFYICGKYGILPKQMLFVGDSKNDIIAANHAGCPVIGLTYGYNYNQPIVDARPDWVFDDFAEILTILD